MEEIKCDCGNNKFYVCLIEGRGEFVELSCTQCGNRQVYGGG